MGKIARPQTAKTAKKTPRKRRNMAKTDTLFGGAQSVWTRRRSAVCPRSHTRRAGGRSRTLRLCPPRTDSRRPQQRGRSCSSSWVHTIVWRNFSAASRCDGSVAVELTIMRVSACGIWNKDRREEMSRWSREEKRDYASSRHCVQLVTTVDRRIAGVLEPQRLLWMHRCRVYVRSTKAVIVYAVSLVRLLARILHNDLLFKCNSLRKLFWTSKSSSSLRSVISQLYH